jgi:hypothetical protein
VPLYQPLVLVSAPDLSAVIAKRGLEAEIKMLLWPYPDRLVTQTLHGDSRNQMIAAVMMVDTWMRSEEIWIGFLKESTLVFSNTSLNPQHITHPLSHSRPI